MSNRGQTGSPPVVGELQFNAGQDHLVAAFGFGQPEAEGPPPVGTGLYFLNLVQFLFELLHLLELGLSLGGLARLDAKLVDILVFILDPGRELGRFPLPMLDVLSRSQTRNSSQVPRRITGLPPPMNRT